MGVKKIGMVEEKEITDEGLKCLIDGEETFLEADTIVLARGATPNDALGKALKDKVPELHMIGDCKECRSALEAIHEGYRLAITI